MTEKRVYICTGTYDEDSSPLSFTNEEFMTHAEDSGKVFTLDGFVDAFNNGCDEDGDYISSDMDFIRILDVETSYTEDPDDFLETSEKELEYMRKIRLEFEKAHNSSVVTEITDISPETIGFRVTMDELNIDDLLIINRKTLTWTLA